MNEDLIRREMEPGERLLWYGQPRQGGFRWSTKEIPVLLFGLFFFGFSLFWMAMASRTSIWFALFGLPFACVGAFILFGRFVVDHRQRARTHYGITDQHVILVVGNRTRILDLDAVSAESITEHRDGTGTLDLGQRRSAEQAAQQMTAAGWLGGSYGSRLDLIDDPRHVLRILREAKGVESRLDF